MYAFVYILPYNPRLCPEHFMALKTVYTQAWTNFIVAIEHVGSTAIPILVAKSVLNIDIIAPLFQMSLFAD